MARQIDIRVLGPMEVLVDDRPVALPGKRLRGLLAALLVRPRHVLTPDQLIEDVWGVRAHRTARASLHNLVSTLRRTLGSDVLVTTSAGYGLAIEDVQTDAGTFEALVAEAMTSTARQRLESLSDALALWRGSPYVDVRYESFAQYEIVRLEELHIWALEERIAARLELGEPHAVVADLTGLVSRFPLRERLRRMLILSLHRSGRPIDAVAVYVDWHRRLAAAGFVPANALSQMHDELEALAPGIAACLRVDASSRRAGRYPRRTLRREADEPGATWRLCLARRRIRALVAQRQEHRVPNPATEARHLPGALQDVGLSTNQCATVGWWAGRRQRGRRWLSCVGATPTGSIRDTVAERRGARLQSAAQRFDSARCLFLPRIERRMER